MSARVCLPGIALAAAVSLPAQSSAEDADAFSADLIDFFLAADEVEIAAAEQQDLLESLEVEAVGKEVAQDQAAQELLLKNEVVEMHR